MDDEKGEEEGVPKGPKLPLTVFIAEGKLHYRNGQYNKAIDNYDTVLEREPKNVKILTERSKCYLRLMRQDLAMVDALDALKLDKKSVDAICQKGEIEYISGDFEFAYLTFQRGLQRRPYCLQLRLGMQKCEDAILNAIGPNSGLTITKEDIEAVERRLNPKSEDSGRKIFKKYQDEEPSTSIQDAKQTNILLKEAGKDKNYFEELQKKPAKFSQSSNPKDTTVKDRVHNALNFLRERQKFWKMDKPWHARRKVQCILRVPLKKFKKTPETTDEEQEEEIPIQEKVLKFFDCANKYLQKGRYNQCMKACTDAMEILDSAGERVIEGKNMIKARILEIMGWVQQDLGDLDAAIDCHIKERAIAEEEALEGELLGALVNLGQDYLLAEKYEDSLEVLEQALPMAELDIERAYILKNISACKLSLQDLTAAMDSGQRALEMARMLADADLELEILFLLAIASENKNSQAAFDYYEQALELATSLGNEEKKREIKDILDALSLNYRLW